MVSVDDVVKRLKELPSFIQAGEKALLDAFQSQQNAEGLLKEKEASLTLDGTIDGKNAEIRAAQMAGHTAVERAAVKQAEKKVAEERVWLNSLLNEFRALRAIAQLLSREVA